MPLDDFQRHGLVRNLVFDTVNDAVRASTEPRTDNEVTEACFILEIGSRYNSVGGARRGVENCCARHILIGWRHAIGSMDRAQDVHRL